MIRRVASACPHCGGAQRALQADGAKSFSVNPVEAIDFLKKKLNVPTAHWTDLWQEQHSDAFTVAGATTDALVSDFHDAVNKAIADGSTLEDFRKDFDTIVEDHGWSYNGSRGWRSRVIFETNMRTAYAAGRWEQIQQVKDDRPYLRYVAVMDDHTRPEHALWNDTVLPADDEWWLTHFPPNGWNCRCSVQSLNDRDLERYGLTVNAKAPPSEMVERTINTPDGARTVLVPEGIDPGFGYRPGAPPAEAIDAALKGR
jgi:SPP1 gp7 family putative phage head morphogenesis protein